MPNSAPRPGGPRLLARTVLSPMLTIEISEADLFAIVYRLRHQDRLHNVHPDPSEGPREALEKLMPLDYSYQPDCY